MEGGRNTPVHSMLQQRVNPALCVKRICKDVLETLQMMVSYMFCHPRNAHTDHSDQMKE